jgi:hypothetical protein
MWTPRSPEALGALLLMFAVASTPVAADDTSSERARIARERAAVEAQAREGEAECTTRFAVSSCAAKVRAERRSKIQSLDRQSSLLDEAQRHQRAAERLERVRQRQAAAASAPPVAIALPRVARPAAPPSSAAPQAPKAEAREAAKASRRDAEARNAARRAEASASRTREAQAYREAVERRNREREAGMRKPSAPLPPGGSAASSPK